MDVDHAEEPMTIIGTGGRAVGIGTLIGLVMREDIGDTIATEDMTGMITGEIAIETGTATGRGVGAAVRFSQFVRCGWLSVLLPMHNHQVMRTALCQFLPVNRYFPILRLILD